MQIGFQNEAERENFYGEIINAFKTEKWIADGSCEVLKDKSSLHIHPQQIIGDVLTDLVPEIISILKSLTVSKLQGYSIGENIYDITAAEEIEHLQKHKNEIKERLSEFCKVHRKNHYKVFDFWSCREICRPFILPVLDEREGNKAIMEFMSCLLKEAVNTGELIKRVIKGESCYRTPFKYELPTNRRNVKPVINPLQMDLF
jgi:hypothetical protein